MDLKNKTAAVYLALLLGVFGAHRWYLKGWRDIGIWLHMFATILGLIGLRRAWALGQDDRLAWLLLPLLALSIAAACLSAIVIGLNHKEKTTGVAIFGVILALLLGSTALMSAIAYTGQRYFEITQNS